MKKILVTENETILLETIVNGIKNHFPEFEIFPTQSGSEAIRCINKNNFDLFILDVGLDDFSGIDLAKKIRSYSNYYTTPIIFVTADPNRELEAFRNTHCHGYMLKPIDELELVKIIRKLITTSSIVKANESKLLLKFKSHKQWIQYQDIYYISLHRRKIRIFFKNDFIDYKPIPLKSFIHQIDNSFVQIQKKIFINISHIKAVNYIEKWLELYDCEEMFSVQPEFLNSLHNQLYKITKINNQNSTFESSVEFDLLTTHFGNKIVENYDIKRMVYLGQNSQIYLLNNKITDQLVTLKAMPVSKGLLSDLSSLKSLSLQGVAQLLDWGLSNNYTYSIKPYYDGISLDQWIIKNGTFSEKEVMSLAMKIKKILIELHSLDPPVVFRDLKPSNIILQPDGEVILVDVETARKIKKKGESDTVILGTRGYAPPEQYGFSQTGTQADIYALGATTYFLAKNQVPSFEDVFLSNGPIKGLSNELSNFIRGCMQFDPNKRKW